MSYLQKIVDGHDLSVEEAEALMGEIFNGMTDAQIGALLISLRMKGESVSEIAGLAKKMRRLCSSHKSASKRYSGRYLRHGRRCLKYHQC